MLLIKVKQTGDTVRLNCWVWLAGALGFSKSLNLAYHSEKYNFSFSSFSQYWEEIGKKEALAEVIASNLEIKGISTSEMISLAARYSFGRRPGVVLFNIDLSSVGRIKDRLPGANITPFLQSFVMIPAKNREHALKILGRIPETLAEGIAIDDGFIIDTNRSESFKASGQEGLL
jgi:hypothetical protein